MTIRGINHINIGTDRLDETRAFFRDVLGLAEGWRPDFQFPGAWLYAGEVAVVHLVELSSGKRPSNEAALDHFAFDIDDYEGTLGRIQSAGVACRAVAVPGAPIRQIFLTDPNGVNIELNYSEAGAPVGRKRARAAVAAS